jgi:hypothetical protein
VERQDDAAELPNRTFEWYNYKEENWVPGIKVQLNTSSGFYKDDGSQLRFEVGSSCLTSCDGKLFKTWTFWSLWAVIEVKTMFHTQQKERHPRPD